MSCAFLSAYALHVERHTTSPEWTRVWPTSCFFAASAALATRASHFLAAGPSHFRASRFAFVADMHRQILHLHPLLIPEACITLWGLCLPLRCSAASPSSSFWSFLRCSCLFLLLFASFPLYLDASLSLDGKVSTLHARFTARPVHLTACHVFSSSLFHFSTSEADTRCYSTALFANPFMS